MDRNEFFPALPVTRLSLRLIGATLEVFTDDVPEIHVMVSGEDRAVEDLRVQSGGDQLTVEQKAVTAARSAASGGWMQVTVRLPRDWKGSIEARTVSGWITARYLSGADLSMDSVSGMVSGTDLNFITVGARSITGDVKLCGLRCEKCSLSTTSGDITVNGASLRTGSAATVTGTVTFDLTDPFEELTFNAISGEMWLTAPIDVCDALLRSVSGRIRTNGVSIIEGAAKVRATTVSSDLDITRSDLRE